MSELHYYGLVCFSTKTGEIDTTMTALGRGLIQYWALQNTTKGKACVIVDIDERKVFSEYIGTVDGFPEIHKSEDEFEFGLPVELWDIFDEEVENRKLDNELNG